MDHRTGEFPGNGCRLRTGGCLRTGRSGGTDGPSGYHAGGEATAAGGKTRGRGAAILPLVVDFARPTPAVGWRCAEQTSFPDRANGFFDSVAMLAVVHHLLVTDQIPLAEIFDAAAQLTRRWLLVEYVGPSDPMFQRLLRGRGELYRWFHRTAFEQHAARRFETVFSREIPGADRCLYLLRRRG